MSNYLKIAFAALLASGILFIGGCKEEDAADEFKVEAGLVGNWSNEIPGDNLRTFSIHADGSFTATLNPSGTDGRGTVEGVLIREDDEYKMNNMKEKTGKDWGGAVGLYNGTYVQIVLSENNTVFTLICADNPPVEFFFGGRYKKQP
jgi:hypothetical protein